MWNNKDSEALEILARIRGNSDEKHPAVQAEHQKLKGESDDGQMITYRRVKLFIRHESGKPALHEKNPAGLLTADRSSFKSALELRRPLPPLRPSSQKMLMRVARNQSG